MIRFALLGMLLEGCSYHHLKQIKNINKKYEKISNWKRIEQMLQLSSRQSDKNFSDKWKVNQLLHLQFYFITWCWSDK